MRVFMALDKRSLCVYMRVCVLGVIKFLNHFNYKKIALGGQKQL